MERVAVGVSANSATLFLQKNMEENNKINELDAMMRLSEVINDSPTVVEIGGQKYNINALKIGTQVLIAEETCKVQKHQEGNMVDVFNSFSNSIPAIIRCIAFALLNDKDKIYKDYSKREFSDEFYATCEKIEWESNRQQWMSILVDVIKKIDISFSFTITEQMSMIRDLMMKKRTPVR